MCVCGFGFKAINKVRKAFENAFEQLKASVKGLRALRESSGVEAERDESILNTIVAIPDELYVHNTFGR